MDEQEALAYLVQCKPLGAKLASQGYEYVFDTADLAYHPVLEQIKDYLPTVEDETNNERALAQSGLTNTETHWLIVFYEMCETLQQKALTPFTFPYMPFKQRFEALEHGRQVEALLPFRAASQTQNTSRW